MQKKFNKFIWILIPILVIGIFISNFIFQSNIKTFEHNLFYMDTYIYIKLYERNEAKAKKAIKQVETIYQDYHKLADRYTSYEGITNIYTIHNNKEQIETISLDSRLYDMIAYGKEWYQKSNKKIDISMGDVLDVWKTYRKKQNGIPTIDELKQNNTSSIDDIVLLNNNQIKNNHINIDLGAIAKGFATEAAGQYLESIGITNYLINAGGNVKVGAPIHKDNFSIGIEDPNSKNGDIFKVIYGKNISVVTSGGYERYYEYEGKQYHHIIDPDTLMPSDYFKSVTVITHDSRLGDILSTTLFLLPIEQGMSFIDQLDAEAIWYTNDNLVITSKGIQKYEQKR